LSKLSNKVALVALKDTDDRVVSAALRSMNWEPIYYPQIKTVIADSSPRVIAHVILALGQNDFEISKDLILECISRFPMNEMVLRSVLAVVSREDLRIYRSEIISNRVFKKNNRNKKSTEWLKRWNDFVLN